MFSAGTPVFGKNVKICRLYRIHIPQNPGPSQQFTDRAVATLKSLGGPRSGKNVGHHAWPTEKISDFEWPKTAQMALKFLFFSGIF